MDDLISCTKLSEHADVCFIDDVDYPLMKNRKVYYIRPRAYIHPLNTQQIIQRILDNGNLIPKTLNLELLRTKEYWYNWFRLKKRGRSRVSNDVAIDIQISQKLICHLTEFLHFTPDYCSPWWRPTLPQLIFEMFYMCPAHIASFVFRFYKRRMLLCL